MYQECRELIRQYYACFPLVFEMAALLLNHYRLAADKAVQDEILQEVIDLCVHVLSGSDDVWLAKQANSLQAVGLMIQQKPVEVLELLEDTMKPAAGDEVILANACQMRGDSQKARLVLQVSIYQFMVRLLALAPSYLSAHMQDIGRFQACLDHFRGVASAFDFDRLRPDLLVNIYYVAALAYAGQQDAAKTMEMLQHFTAACTSPDFAVALHGDAFFDLLDEWLAEYGMNASVPRDIQLIRNDALKLVNENPAFAFLADHPAFSTLLAVFAQKMNGGPTT